MRAKVVGVQPMDFIVEKTGERVLGARVYITREPTPREGGVFGLVSDRIWLKPPLSDKAMTFHPDEDCEFLFDSDGKHSFLVDVRSLATASPPSPPSASAKAA